MDNNKQMEIDNKRKEHEEVYLNSTPNISKSSSASLTPCIGTFHGLVATSIRK